MKTTLITLTVLLASLALATQTPNALDYVAVGGDMAGCIGVAPTMIVGVISEYHPAWRPARNVVAGVTIGSMVTGWTCQGLASWSRTEPDVPLHFGATVTIEGLAYGGLRALRVPHGRALWYSAGTAAALGLAKEGRDALTPGDCWSWSDLGADAVGIALSTGLIAGVEYALREWGR